jgi:hypothetical protein
MLHARFSALALAAWFMGVASTCPGVIIQEDFVNDPAGRGWKVSGDPSLFAWDPIAQDLQVTWDSSRTNSYFYHPLGTVLSKSNDFTVAFDLRLTNFVAGVNPSKPNPFQLAVGLVNLAEASQPQFLRGTGFNSPDLVEFSFFPDPGGAWIWGSSLTSTMIDLTGVNWSTGGFGTNSLSVADRYRVSLSYSASNQTLHTSITRNGTPFGSVSDAQLGASFLDFRVDSVAVCSYSDAGQDPAYAGSILAQGTVDNFVVTFLPITTLSAGFDQGIWQVKFQSLTNWLYALERTTDFQSWTAASPTVNGNSGPLMLQDTNLPASQALYRVRAQTP